MRVKRFVADDMQTAIAQVKADFGRDAVILHTKKLKRGGVFGWFGKEKFEVIAAIDPPTPQSQARNHAESAPSAPPPSTELAAIRRELDPLKRELLDRPAAESIAAQNGAAPPAPPSLVALRERLLEQDIEEKQLEQLLDDVVAIGTEDDHLQPEWVWQRAGDVLGRHLSLAPPWTFTNADPLVVPLVGPTGVGKTTTIAKLAANYSLLANKKVALVTVDTYRIAAVEQLKTYADIIDVPVDVAFTPAELTEAVARHQDADLILIDTAGRSQRNAMHMAELKAFIDVLPNPQVHLVVSATTRFRELVDVIERFEEAHVERLVVTKLDETLSWGGLVNAVMVSGRPLAYVTTGQNVPDDIEVAERDKLVRQLLGPLVPRNG